MHLYTITSSRSIKAPQAKPPFMEPEAVLNLFDTNWFHLGILEKQQKTSTSSTPRRQIQQSPPKQNNSRPTSFHTRSKSEDQQLSALTIEIQSPDSVLKPHLQTILSDREISWETPTKPKRVDRRKKRLSKSLSELEFEEVKGFIDLGFVFSEEDRDSSLVQIIPGLQKLGHQDEDKGEIEESSGVRERPYLSEAWEFSKYTQMEEKMVMMRWIVPLPAVTNEMEIKDNLKSWAHSVAYAVR